MPNSFSERGGIIKPATLNPKEMPIELRNRLWNEIRDYIDKRLVSTGNERNDAILYIWDKFFKQDKDSLKSWDSYML